MGGRDSKSGRGSLEQFLSSLVRRQIIDLDSPDTRSGSLNERLLNVVRKAQQQRSALKQRAEHVSSFGEYLKLLSEDSTIPGEAEARASGVSAKQFLGLLEGSLKPWDLPSASIVSLLDRLNGSFDTAIKLVEAIEVTAQEVDYGGLGQLVARSDRNVRRKDRREGLENAARKMALAVAQRNKQQLLSDLRKEVE